MLLQISNCKVSKNWVRVWKPWAVYIYSKAILPYVNIYTSYVTTKTKEKEKENIIHSL